jgi:dienelactone hydrolase
MLAALASCLALARPVSDPAELAPTEWLVIDAVDRTGRRPFRPDAVFAAHLFDRASPPPRATAADEPGVTGELGVDRRWHAITVAPGARIEGDLACAYARIERSKDEVWIAELSGAGRLWVAGTPFVGDLYGLGMRGVPVLLREGANDLYVTGIRGAFRLVLHEPPADEFVAEWDRTLPDFEPERGVAELAAGILFVNASTRHSPLLGLPPLSIEKRAVTLRASKDELGAEETAKFLLPSVLPQRAEVRLRVVRGGGARRRTFVSQDDGSVQEYGYLPAAGKTTRATVLSLHGAGVDALGQVSSYSPKEDLEIVAPTNRRPFGFDWQDWGRANAYETLRAVRCEPLPQVYLTGHSMGGHGTWHLAANDPDRFLAIAPSAGWASFDSYGGRPEGELRELWHAADGASRTLALLSNLLEIPAFLVHGTADDNVPVSEAQALEKSLRDAGAAPRTHYQEGAGHWWDGDRAAGVDCVDWPGIFELFAEVRTRPITAKIDFTSVDPGVDAEHGWIRVEQPLAYGTPLHVQSELADGVLAITTSNVRELVILRDPEGWDGARLAVDGTVIEAREKARPLALRREGELWSPGLPGPGEKSPEVSGPFKRVFREHFVLVYGSRGSAEETRELFDRARADAQTWWYRGNGRGVVLSDAEFLAQKPERRHVVLYGNADTNGAWRELLGKDPPIDARRGAIRVGTRVFEGTDLGALFVHPARAGRPEPLVGCFADSGPRGTRLGHVLAPFVSGVGYPDYAVYGPEVLRSGDGGVLAAGWFDHRWRIAEGGFRR